ncbi:MAG: hypothetical protein ATN36_04010 [Epulopiscium sp. Nele67-Bin005]|nr:MAG: hypothetical protein ATN36_04010 [Epulopiscium sp. Nele67-Bin005]
MHSKKFFACILSAILLASSSVSISASTNIEAYQTLTLDEAVTRAINYSDTISTYNRQQEYQGLQVDQAKLSYNSYSGAYIYEAALFSRDQVTKLSLLEREIIEYEMTQLFDDILMTQKEYQYQIKVIDQTEKEIRKLEIMTEQGFGNLLQEESLKLQLQTEKMQLSSLEDSLSSMFLTLTSTINSIDDYYILEKEPNEYKPYSYTGSADSLGRLKANDSIFVWAAQEGVDIAELTPLASSFDWYERKDKEETIAQAKDQVSSTKDQVASLVEDLYWQMRQLETAYDTTKLNVELAEKQIRMNEIYFNQGMMSQFDYDSSVLSYEKALIELEKIVNQHTYLCKTINKPDLLLGS